MTILKTFMTLRPVPEPKQSKRSVLLISSRTLPWTKAAKLTAWQVAP